MNICVNKILFSIIILITFSTTGCNMRLQTADELLSNVKKGVRKSMIVLKKIIVFKRLIKTIIINEKYC